MIFSNVHEYSIVDASITEAQLQTFCKENNIEFFNDDAGLWFAFANYYGAEHGLVEIERLSFGRMCSQFFTEVGISCGTEQYFRETEIEAKLMQVLMELARSGLTEDKVARAFFFEMFELYLMEIEQYAIKTETLIVRVSLSMYERFMELEGRNKSEKMRNLLNKR